MFLFLLPGRTIPLIKFCFCFSRLVLQLGIVCGGCLCINITPMKWSVVRLQIWRTSKRPVGMEIDFLMVFCILVNQPLKKGGREDNYKLKLEEFLSVSQCSVSSEILNSDVILKLWNLFHSIPFHLRHPVYEILFGWLIFFRSAGSPTAAAFLKVFIYHLIITSSVCQGHLFSIWIYITMPKLLSYWNDSEEKHWKSMVYRAR